MQPTIRGLLYPDPTITLCVRNGPQSDHVTQVLSLTDKAALISLLSTQLIIFPNSLILVAVPTLYGAGPNSVCHSHARYASILCGMGATHFPNSFHSINHRKTG